MLSTRSLFQRTIMLVRQRTLILRNNNTFFNGSSGTRILPTLTMDQVRTRNIYEGPRNRGDIFEGPRIKRDMYKRPGDWTCSECGYSNFSYRNRCHKCDKKPEHREVAEGDWICPKCEFYNFQSREFCFKCDTPAEMNKA